MKNGFISIPILIAIIISTAITGSVSYVGVQKYQEQKTAFQNEQQAEEISEVQKLREELELLKKQQEEQYELKVSEPQVAERVVERVVEKPVIVQLSAPPSTSFLSVKDIIAKIKPSVVFIETDREKGSGFIIEGDYILTNAHVMEGVYTATVKLWNGRNIEARIHGRDEEVDLALLKHSAGITLNSAQLGDSSKLEQGDKIIALGYPLGFSFGGDVDVREGIVSRIYSDIIGMSAQIMPGHSGGPLVDQNGLVVGVNTFRLEGNQGDNLPFAISINEVKRYLPKLKDGLVSFKSDSIKPPAIPCPENASNINGQCVCNKGYAQSSGGLCQIGGVYCLYHYGWNYLYDDELNECVCDTVQNDWIDNKCVPKN